MIRTSISTALKFGAVALLLFALLLTDNIWRTFPGLLGSIPREITTIFRDPSTQWMAVFCLGCYFLIFLILEYRLSSLGKWWRLGNVNLWLVLLIALVLLCYVFVYPIASNSTQVPVLLAAVVFGKAISTWFHWRVTQIEQQATWLISLLICLFACSALWQPEMTMAFQYRGVSRWNGIWDNPNLYGLLMGVGVVLSFGFLILKSRRWWLIPIILSVGLCGIGLFKSYSRGAWLGTLAALLYLAIQAGKSSRYSGWLCRNWPSLAILVASLLLLVFWQLRFSELRPTQRAFSTINAKDFSWRNRLAAWDGAIHMMADQPLAGFGWGQAESVYDKKYCPLKESAAIEMNDFFMLGISAGVPALVCFVAYLALAYGRRSPSFSSASSIFVVCRGGSIVLLVGFWFDGGLFKLAVAPIFWMLIELSRLEPRTSLPVSTIQKIASHRSKKETWLRQTAWILAVIAGLQTIVYVGTPFLSVNNRTLAVARKCLVPPKEKNDFDFLSDNPVWQDKKLKNLLEHVDLANYNRELVNWQVEDKIYRDFVLSPVIHGDAGEALNWRRSLWEEFYPLIRHKSSPEDAAKIVVRRLRERVKIATGSNLPHDVPGIWLRRITDESGFEIIYVAVLRSVGIPAQLDSSGKAEMLADGKWQPAPKSSESNPTRQL